MSGSYKDIKIYLSIFLTIQVLKKKYTLVRLYLDNYIKEFKLLKPCVLVSNAKLEKKVSCQMVSLANEIKKGKLENTKSCCKELSIKKNNILHTLLYPCMPYYKLW